MTRQHTAIRSLYQFSRPSHLPIAGQTASGFCGRVLKRTEFYNDFLKVDDLDHGINIFLFDGDRDLGDFRLWRAAGSPDFSDREIKLLDMLAPYLKRALMRKGCGVEGLTAREQEISSLVARGLRDRDIAKLLGIGFGTVRTHINSA